MHVFMETDIRMQTYVPRAGILPSPVSGLDPEQAALAKKASEVRAHLSRVHASHLSRATGSFLCQFTLNSSRE